MATGAEAGYFGLKPSVIIAGFVGSMLTMSFVRQLTKPQMATALATGTITAHYLTPLTLYYSGLAVGLENGIAFLIGIMAMNIIPGLLKLSDMFRSDPRSFVQNLGKSNDDADSN